MTRDRLWKVPAVTNAHHPRSSPSRTAFVTVRRPEVRSTPRSTRLSPLVPGGGRLWLLAASLPWSGHPHAPRPLSTPPALGVPPRLRVMASGCRPGHREVPHCGRAQPTQPQPTCNRLFPNTPRPARAPGGRARMLGSGAPTACRGPDRAPLQHRTQWPLPSLFPVGLAGSPGLGADARVANVCGQGWDSWSGSREGRGTHA